MPEKWRHRDQDIDLITGAEPEELGNVTDGGRGAEAGAILPAYLKLCILGCVDRSRALICPAPIPNPTANFVLTGSMGVVSVLTCLEEKALGWWTRNGGELLEQGPRAGCI